MCTITVNIIPLFLLLILDYLLSGVNFCILRGFLTVHQCQHSVSPVTGTTYNKSAIRRDRIIVVRAGAISMLAYSAEKHTVHSEHITVVLYSYTVVSQDGTAPPMSQSPPAHPLLKVLTQDLPYVELLAS
jgi:hypothetical protein